MPKGTYIPIIADVTESAYFVWLNLHQNGTEFGVYFPTDENDQNLVPILDREMDTNDNQLTYAEFLALDDITTIQRDNTSEDFDHICSVISQISGAELDEVAEIDDWNEHLNDKAVYYTPAES